MESRKRRTAKKSLYTLRRNTNNIHKINIRTEDEEQHRLKTQYHIQSKNLQTPQGPMIHGYVKVHSSYHIVKNIIQVGSNLYHQNQ